MKFLNIFSSKTIVFLALSISLLIVSCSNPAESDDEHEHAAGAVLMIDGEEAARYWDDRVTGTLEVEAGEESPLITIHFLDEHGDRFHPHEGEYELRWEEIDTAIAELRQPESGETWSFHLIGIEPGETSVQLHMHHTAEEHSDFFTPGIPIRVN